LSFFFIVFTAANGTMMSFSPASSDAKDETGNLSGLIDKNVVNISDSTFFGIVNGLLVVVGNSPTFDRSRRHRGGGIRA
jgi:hypothetical protein